MNIQDLMQVAKGKNILIVEDSENISESLAFLMRKFFNNVEIAENGREGLEKFEEGKFDIIITDLRMPYLNGIEMIKEIKKIDENQSIIITTAFEDEEGAEALESFKDIALFVKPINMEALFSALINQLKN
jgi:DNA-binding NtrC family response regulator